MTRVLVIPRIALGPLPDRGVRPLENSEDGLPGLWLERDLTTAASALCRELAEELAWTPDRGSLNPAACRYEGESAIGLVHLGLIYPSVWAGENPSSPAPFEPMASLSFRPATAIASDDRFELWSRLVAGWAVGGA